MSAGPNKSGRGKRRQRDEGNGFEEWGGYMNAKIQKLQGQFKDSRPGTEVETNIFEGIAIFVNGYTKPSSDELKKLMLRHSGVYHHYYSRNRVTHIIATNLPNSKIASLTDKKVCRPEWITDSIKNGKLLPYESYLLYTARSTIQPGIQKFKTVPSKPNDSRYSLNKQVKDANNSADVTTDNSELVTSVADSQNATSVEANRNSTAVCAAKQVSPAPVQKTQKETPTAQNNVKASFRSPSKAGNPNFLSEFYTHSRLHYLSTWGAEFRAYVTQLQTTGETSFPGREKLRDMIAEKLSAKDGTTDQDTTHQGRYTPGRGRPEKVIMHIDMDSFFVSVGLRDRPDLIGKPVAVTHSRGKGVTKERPDTDLQYEMQHWKRKGLRQKKGPGKGKPLPDCETNPDLFMMDEFRGEDLETEEDRPKEKDSYDHVSEKEAFHSMADIASCSYEARQAGVKNGMFMGKARQLCPDLVTIPYDFEGYKSVSLQLYDTVATYTHDIEAVSCDEMLVDCTDLLADTGSSPEEFVSLLRAQIKEKTKCNASAGLGPNILLARMATRVAKPNGQFHLKAEDAADFIQDKSVRDIPGVGYAVSNKLHLLDVRTCGELQKITLATLQKEFGPKNGQSLHRYSRGLDDRQIRVERERKSVSAEINYGIRFTMDNEVQKFIAELSEELHSRLTKLNMKGKTITLKLKVRRKDAPKETAKFLGHGLCDTIAKSATLPVATDDSVLIARECMTILRPLAIAASDHRGIGIQMSRLEAPAGTNRSSALGKQSILSFTTKRDMSPSVQSSTCTDKPGASLETPPVPSDSSLQDKKAEQNGASPELQTKGQGYSSDLRSEEKSDCLPPLPTLPSFTSPPSSQDIHHSQRMAVTPTMQPSREDLYLPSPSQVDLDVLRELPPDIRHQIEAEIKAKKKKKETSKPHSTRITRSQSTSSDCSPSIEPVQINQRTTEVPPDNSDPGNHSRKAKSEPTSRVTRRTPQPEIGQTVVADSAANLRPTKSPVPGCSHWASQSQDNEVILLEVEEEEKNKEREQETVQAEERVTGENDIDEEIVALPSYSQLDMECLSALPPELQEELRQAYAQEDTKLKQTSASIPNEYLPKAPEVHVHPLMLQVHRSPTKSPKKSPSKRSPQKTSSPQFKVPQGRPGRSRGRPKKHLSPKKLNFVSSSSIDRDAHRSEETMEKVLETETLDKNVPVSDPEVPLVPSGPNLCGAVTLTEVKVLLREWVSSCTAPEEEDQGRFLQYLHDLMSDKKLDMVDLLLKFLKRYLRNCSAADGWKQSYDNIVIQTQNIVKAVYGATLKM